MNAKQKRAKQKAKLRTYPQLICEQCRFVNQLHFEPKDNWSALLGVICGGCKGYAYTPPNNDALALTPSNNDGAVGRLQLPKKRTVINVI